MVPAGRAHPATRGSTYPTVSCPTRAHCGPACLQATCSLPRMYADQQHARSHACASTSSVLTSAHCIGAPCTDCAGTCPPLRGTYLVWRRPSEGFPCTLGERRTCGFPLHPPCAHLRPCECDAAPLTRAMFALATCAFVCGRYWGVLQQPWEPTATEVRVLLLADGSVRTVLQVPAVPQPLPNENTLLISPPPAPRLPPSSYAFVV